VCSSTLSFAHVADTLAPPILSFRLPSLSQSLSLHSALFRSPRSPSLVVAKRFLPPSTSPFLSFAAAVPHPQTTALAHPVPLSHTLLSYLSARQPSRLLPRCMCIIYFSILLFAPGMLTCTHLVFLSMDLPPISPSPSQLSPHPHPSPYLSPSPSPPPSFPSFVSL
jgi:hypothetical protein